MPSIGEVAQLLLFSQHDSCPTQSWLGEVGIRSSSVEWQVKLWEQRHYHLLAVSEN